MTCPNTTVNNRPLGVAYNPSNQAVGLSELTDIKVNSVSPVTGTIVFNGPVSAVSYLGVGGPATNFVDLGDVEPGLSLTPDYMIVVNSLGYLSNSSVANVMVDYATTALVAANYATTSTTNSLDSRLTTAEGDITTLQSDIASLSLGASLTDINLGSLSNGDVLSYNAAFGFWQNLASSTSVAGGGATVFTALTDVPANYTGAANKFVKVNSGGTGLTFVADPGYAMTSSLSSVSASLSSAVSNSYLLKSGGTGTGTFNLPTINTGSTIVSTALYLPYVSTNQLLFLDQNNQVTGIGLAGDFGTEPTANSFLGTDGTASIITSYPIANYTTEAKNLTLSSNVANHIASAEVHFYASSLSSNPGYALSSWVNSNYVLTTTNNNLSSQVSNHIGSAVHWDLTTLNTNYINSSGDSATGSFYFSNLSASVISATNFSGISLSASLRDVSVATPSNGNALVWNGIRWVASALPTGGGGITHLYEALDTINFPVITGDIEDRSIIVWNDSVALWETWKPSSYQSELAAYLDHNSLQGLASNSHPQYVLSATNSALSSQVSSHITSAVHWTQSTLDSNFINSSGDSANANFYFSGLSATVLSATQLTLRDNTGARNKIPEQSADLGDMGFGINEVYTKGPGYVLMTSGPATGVNRFGLYPSSTFAGVGGSPGGSNTQIQFNDGGSTFNGDSALTWNKDTDTLSATNISATTIYLGGSNGYLKNQNGAIYISATGGTIFPSGLSALSVTSTNMVISASATITNVSSTFVQTNEFGILTTSPYIGTAAPSDSFGENGDLYFQYTT